MGKVLTLIVDGIELTKADIKERFEKYNKLYFDGKLGKCKFYWISTKQGCYGWCNVNYIGLARDINWTENDFQELLVHEMIHMYIVTVEGKRLDGLNGHGRRFRAHCRRLKKDFGLKIHIRSFSSGFEKEHLRRWKRVSSRAINWMIDCLVYPIRFFVAHSI